MITSTENHGWYENEYIDEAAEPIAITLGEERQQIRGFGGCFNELGAIALESLTEEKRGKVNDELFSPEQCGFTFCRLSIGANDFASSWYSYDEVPGDYELRYFSIDRDKKYIIPWIKEAQKRFGGMKFMASPWSPPTWMKFPAVYNYGTLIQTPENLRAYALYFQKFVECYAAEGIPVVQIHVQNEPASTQKFPSCEWTGEEFRNFIKNYLGEVLEGKADIFFGTINAPGSGEKAFSTRFYQYAQTVMRDRECRKYVKGVSYQWAGKFAVQQTRDSYPDLELIQSESECGDGQNTWQYAMYIYEMMHHYFRNGVSAYLYWNMVLADGGESSWGWKQNSLVTVRDGEVQYNPEFYLMKHFSHFVKPGARYLESKGEWSAHTTAFRNPDGSVILVMMNPFDEKVTVSVQGNIYTLMERSFNTVVL